MSTDITSLIKTSQTKSSVMDKLSLKVSSSVDNGFESLLSNVSKSYTTKPSAEKTSYFADKNYAQKTKDVRASKNVVENNTEKSTALKQENVNNIDKQQNNRTEKTQDKSVDKNVETGKKINSNTIKEDTIETEDTSQVKNNVESKVQETETKEVVENDEMKNQSSEKQDTSKQEEQNQENKSEVDVQASEAQNQKSEVTKNVLVNEQIIANVEQVNTTNISEEVIVKDATIEEVDVDNKLNIVDNEVTKKSDTKAEVSKNKEAKADNNFSQQVKTFDNVLKQTELTTQNTKETQVSKEVVEQVKTQVIDNKKLANVIMQQSVEQIVADTVSNENVVSQNLKTINVNASEIMNQLKTTDVNNISTKDVTANISANLSSDMIVEPEVDVDLKAVNKDSLEVLKQTEPQKTEVPLRTVKDNLISDVTRYTVNLEDMTNEVPEEIKIVTPTVKQEVSTENIQTTIKVTEEVASQVKANEVTVGKDFTTNVKDKADAKMSALKDTNTVVTQVQNSNENNTQSNLNQNNSSFTQTNANEQVARMSVDNSEINLYSNNAADSFFAKLDSKLSSSVKLASQNSVLNKTDILNQMNAKFSEMQQAGQNKVSIILQPENLGRVAVEIMNSKDGIVAKMTTENQQVKELFDKNIEALKSTLGAQGVNVNNIKVECTHESSNNAMNFEREQFNQSNFNNSNGQNRQTNNSDNSQSSYTGSEYATSEDATEEASNTVELKNTETIVKHDGKVDYKV